MYLLAPFMPFFPFSVVYLDTSSNDEVTEVNEAFLIPLRSAGGAASPGGGGDGGEGIWEEAATGAGGGAKEGFRLELLPVGLGLSCPGLLLP